MKKFPEDEDYPLRVEKLLSSTETFSTGQERAAFLKGAFQADPQLQAEYADLFASAVNNPVRDAQKRSKELKLSELPGFISLQLVGEGGMGQVYRAEQQVPFKRMVAIKVLKLGLASDQILRRFANERQTLAMLNHPAIAKVFDAGVTASGQTYFVMEWIEGTPLSRFVAERSLTLRARLALFADICRAAAHAHQKGVIHRDLKPGNILVHQDGDRILPKIIDFGIAKAVETDLGDETVLTEASQLLGTPAYMSPEQADLACQSVDTRADIYSMGVILYELISGALPFSREELLAEGYAGMLRVLAERTPKLPSRRALETSKSGAAKWPETKGVNPREIAGDLDAIVMKCIEKDADNRYPTSDALREDIDRFLMGKPVSARRTNLLYFVLKFVGRNQALCAGIAGVLCTLVLGLAFTFFYANQLRHTNASLNQRLYIADMSSALEAHRATKVNRVSELIQRYDPDANDGIVDRREFEWYFLSQETQNFDQLPSYNLEDPVYEIALDRKRRRLLMGGLGSDFKFFDLESRSVTHTFPVCGDELTRQINFSPNSEQAVVCCGGLVIIDTEGSVLSRYKGKTAEIAANYSPDGHWIAHGGIDGVVNLWDLQKDLHIAMSPSFIESQWVEQVIFTPDQEYLIAASDQEIMVWRFSTRELLARWFPHQSPSDDTPLDVGAITLSPDGRTIVAAGYNDGKVKRFDVRTGELAEETDTPSVYDGPKFMSPVSLNQKGNLLFIADNRNTLQVLDMNRGKLTKPVHGHSSSITSMVYFDEEQLLITAGKNGLLKFWDTEALDPSSGFHTRLSEGNTMTFSPDGSRLAVPEGSAQDGVAVKIWDARSHQLIKKLYSEYPVFRVEYDTEGDVLYGMGRRHLRRWFLDSDDAGEVLFEVPSDYNTFEGRISDGARYAVLVDRKLPLRLVELKTGRDLGFFGNVDDRVNAVAIYSQAPGKTALEGRDYVTAAGGTELGDVLVWRILVDSKGGMEILSTSRVNGAHDRSVTAIALSHTGAQLATGGFDTRIMIWDVETLKQEHVFLDHYGWLYDLEFSPTGRTLASGSTDTTLRLWDLVEFQSKGMFVDHQNYVLDVAFSRDGKNMASVGDDGYVIVRRGSP